MPCPYCKAETDEKAKICLHCGRDPELLKPVFERLSLIEAQIAGLSKNLETSSGDVKATQWWYICSLAVVPAVASYLLIVFGHKIGVQSVVANLLLSYAGVIVTGFVLGRFYRDRLHLWIFLVIALSSLVHFTAVSYSGYVSGNFAFNPFETGNIETLVGGAIVLAFALLIGRVGGVFSDLPVQEQFVVAVEMCIILVTLGDMLRAQVAGSP